MMETPSMDESVKWRDILMSQSKGGSSKSPDPRIRSSLTDNKKCLQKSVTGGGIAAEDSSDGSSQHVHSGRKKRARSTPDDYEANGRKSQATEFAGQRDSSLWPGDTEGPVQSSLLEEVLAEKKMALLRSPEVIFFLQQHQARIRASKTQALLATGRVDFDANVEEDEDDSQPSS